MNRRVEVLRAILRCSRHRRTADRAALALRVEVSRKELDKVIRTLVGQGLVVDGARGVRLTMTGLAIAVASIPRIQKAVKKTKARAA